MCFDSQEKEILRIWGYLEYKSCLQDILFKLTWTSSLTVLAKLKFSAVLILSIVSFEKQGFSRCQSKCKLTKCFVIDLVMFYTYPLRHWTQLHVVWGYKHMHKRKSELWSSYMYREREAKQHKFTIYLKYESTQAINQTINKQEYPNNSIISALKTRPQPLKLTNSGLGSQLALLNLLQMLSLPLYSTFLAFIS